MFTLHVSMPSTGFYSFLQGVNADGDFVFTMCQCPQRASTHFYNRNMVDKFEKITVSMPSTGFYSFLQDCGRSDANIEKKCQCPQRASTHFYISMDRLIDMVIDCVNALNGLLLIST